ncbi:Uncharacterised protein [Mycobacteroides abscessus subsp. massiliense]|nr:Uncharacterised protein [Mycobacteroides abscessus subsp. massiliense]
MLLVGEGLLCVVLLVRSLGVFLGLLHLYDLRHEALDLRHRRPVHWAPTATSKDRLKSSNALLKPVASFSQSAETSIALPESKASDAALIFA